MQGKFITVEGPDGAGKSTAIKYLKHVLEQCGLEVVVTREPGGAVLSEKIRELIFGNKMHPMTELLLFAASRAEHVEALIKPALMEGKIVLCDRFADSSYAYQGAGRGYAAEVLDLEALVLDGFEPDYTLFFSVTLEESNRRLAGRQDESNRFDEEQAAFKERVFNGYSARFVTHRHRMHRIDAMQPMIGVEAQLGDWVHKVLLPAVQD